MHPRKLTRSALVGAVATAVDLSLLVGGVELLHLDPRVVTAASLAVGVAIQFVGNKVFAFRDRSAAWVRQATLFFLVEVAAYVMNVTLFALAAPLLPLPYPVVRAVVGALVYFAICLPLWSRIFRHEAPSEVSA